MAASLIQSVNEYVSADGVLSLTSVAIGDLIIVTQTGQASAASTIADTLSSTWVPGTTRTHGASSSAKAWYTFATSAGADTITVSTQFSDPGFICEQFRGLDPAGTVVEAADVTDTGATGDVNVSVASLSLVYAAWCAHSGGGSISTAQAPLTLSVNDTSAAHGSAYDLAAGAGTYDAQFNLAASAPNGITLGFAFPILPDAVLEQTAFRFREDDDDENSATWIASENTDISRAPGVNTRIRIQTDVVGDAPSQGYQLDVSHNSGAYAKVPLTASSEVAPVIVTADATESGNNTATNSWAVSTPALSTGDLIVMIIGWDDSTTTTSVSPANGPNGETWTQFTGGPVASSSTEVLVTMFYTIATGAWSAGSITVTPSASEQWTASVLKVPAGEFDAVTPIGDQDSRASAADETDALSPAMTLGASDGGGRLVWAACVDTDPLTTLGSGWTQVTNTDRGAVALGVATRNADTSDSESVAGGDTWAIASDTWCSIAFVVRGITVLNPVHLTASAHIAAGATDATTAQLSVPNSHSFTAGKMSDDTNPVTVDIADDRYTENEYNVTINASAVSDNDTLDFRQSIAGVAYGTYTEIGRITVDEGGGGGGLTIPIAMPHYMKLGAA